MLDLFLKLVDRCIDLMKRRQEIDRAFFSDFVAPIMADFEAKHKDYLASFRRYRELILTEGEFLTRNHPVFQQIQEDYLFSTDLRAKLEVLFEREPHDRLVRLVGAIGLYLLSADRIGAVNRPHECRVRMDYRAELERICDRRAADAEKRKSAITLLDTAVADIQARYEAVLREYAELREHLLAPK